jgi:acyl carrier protein
MSPTGTDRISDTVRRILADITLDDAVLDMSLDTRLREDLGIDSMTSLTFLMALEDEIPGFMVDATTLTAEHFQTIGGICAYVVAQLAASGLG